MKRIEFAAALLALAAPSALAQPPAGPEFLVDTYTTGAHGDPAVAADAHGNFVAVWQRDGGLFGQRFTAGGVRRGTEFEVSASGSAPSVASSATGAFVVAWHDYGTDGSGTGVSVRRFDASGAALGDAVAVNTYTTGTQATPAVAADAAGNFVVAWQSAGQDGPGYGVFARRFDAGGTSLGGEIQVSAIATPGFTSNQSQPDVAAHPGGGFVVVWSSRVSIFSLESRALLGRRYDAAGAPIGEFQVTQTTSGRPSGPDVGLDGSGRFVVAWTESLGGFPLPSAAVMARRFDASATPLANEFEVPTASFSQGGPSVGMDLAGGFTIAWLSRGQEGEQFFNGVYAQRFDAAGASVGGEFRVNTYTTGDQRSAAVVSGPDENFTVLWDGPTADSATVQVLGQRYGDVIFRDGFPAEGLGRWSVVADDGGDLRVSAAAALDGSPTGLEAAVDDTAPLFVQDETPTAEPLYRALFHFDPNGFDPGEAQNHLRTRVFIGFDSASRRAFALVLRRRNGEYALMARVRLTGGGRVNTGFVPISDEPHLVEVLYAAETAPGADDGALILAVDNAVVATLEPLDMGAPVERARLGALSVKGGAAGSLLFDGFDSRRSP